MRLNQYIAHAGVCSRRKADDLIARGTVYVNGVLASHPSIRVQATDKITYKGKALSIKRKIYLLFNKPFNCITTRHDPQQRKTIMHFLPKNLRDLYPVGRLDRNTCGAILITNDGYLASALAHPAKEIEKQYEVKLKKNLTNNEVKQLSKGIVLEDGIARVDAIRLIDPTHIVLHLHSGKNRIIRRMFSALNHSIRCLERVAYAGLTCANVPQGKWRHLTEDEVARLYQMVGL